MKTRSTSWVPVFVISPIDQTKLASERLLLATWCTGVMVSPSLVKSVTSVLVILKNVTLLDEDSTRHCRYSTAMFEMSKEERSEMENVEIHKFNTCNTVLCCNLYSKNNRLCRLHVLGLYSCNHTKFILGLPHYKGWGKGGTSTNMLRWKYIFFGWGGVGWGARPLKSSGLPTFVISLMFVEKLKEKGKMWKCSHPLPHSGCKTM